MSSYTHNMAETLLGRPRQGSDSLHRQRVDLLHRCAQCCAHKSELLHQRQPWLALVTSVTQISNNPNQGLVITRPTFLLMLAGSSIAGIPTTLCIL